LLLAGATYHGHGRVGAGRTIPLVSRGGVRGTLSPSPHSHRHGERSVCQVADEGPFRLRKLPETCPKCGSGLLVFERGVTYAELT
jgi:hypothetical protein